MADGILVTAGLGTTVATDDCGAAGHAQITKLGIATDGSATPIPADATNGLLVDVSRVAGSVAVTNAGITTIAGAVSGLEMQVDVLTMPTVTVNAHAVTNAGTFVTQVDGAALTALQLIDNLVLAEDAVHGSGDPGVQMLAVRKDSAAAIATTDGDYTPLQVDSTGALRVTGGTSSTQYAEDAAHTTGDTGTMALGVRRDANTALATTDGDYAPYQLTALGALKVAITEDSVGSATDTDDGSIAAAQASVALVLGLPHTFDGTAWVRGGLTPISYISAATTNATSTKGSAGILGFCYVTNVNAAVRYLKLYNKATAPTVGTDTPLLRFAIPGNTTGAGFALPIPEKGLAFSTGIAWALTTGVADSDTAAVAANEILVNLGYK